MRPFFPEQRKHPCTPAELADFEDEVGHRMPSAYRRFLVEVNGGEPCPCNFRVGSKTGKLRWFFGLGLGRSLDLRKAYRRYISSGRVSRQMLPIGQDDGSNLYLLCLAGRESGQVLYWSHEPDNEWLSRSPDSSKELRFHRLQKVAGSFEQLWDGFASLVSPRQRVRPDDETLKLYWMFFATGEKGRTVQKIRQALAGGGDPDVHDSIRKSTPLHVEACGTRPEAVKLLLSWGADATATDFLGQTPLHNATMAGRRKIIRLLVQAGADLRAEDKSGDTPLDYIANTSIAAAMLQLAAKNRR